MEPDLQPQKATDGKSKAEIEKGARRQMQGGALVPPGFCFLVFCRTLFMHRV